MGKINCIRTYTGMELCPLDPKVEDISTADIGRALSLICRANGHSKHFYSVAQHSINCAKEAKNRGYSERMQLACLLHDASEAYISDIIRPVKQHLNNYLEIEGKLQNVIYEAYGIFNLTKEELELIKTIDDAMLKYEMAMLLNYYDISGEDVMEKYNLDFKMMDIVEVEFIGFLEELKHNAETLLYASV